MLELALRQALEGLPQHAQGRRRFYGEQLLERELLQRHTQERAKALEQRLFVFRSSVKANPSNSLEQRNLARLEHEFDALTSKRDKLNQQRISYEQIVRRCDQFCIELGAGYQGPYWTDEEPQPAELLDGEDFAAAIQRLRSKVSALNARLAQLRSAPPPPAEIRAMIRADLQRRQQSAGFGYRIVRDGMGVDRLELVAPDLHAWLSAGSGANPTGITTAWFAAWDFEKTVQLFSAGVDDNASGIPAKEKPRLLAELEARVIDLELEEMSLVEQGQQQGLELLPRPSMSPLALLGLVPLRQPEELQAIAAE